jgi:hypothetical protein
VVTRTRAHGTSGLFEYRLTPSGRDLQALIEGFGVWGQRWIKTEMTLQNLDPQLLMWDMRRNLDIRPLPRRRSTIQFVYPDVAPTHRTWWLVVAPDKTVDLCSVDPGFEVDLLVSSDLRTMTSIWMGLQTVRKAVAERRMKLAGDKQLAAKTQLWLGLSPFAKERKVVA